MSKLSPAQQSCYDRLVASLDVGSFVVVHGKRGRGKSTILRQLHADKKSKFVDTREFVERISLRDPLQMEEVLEEMLRASMKDADLVIMDDIDLIYDVICGCGHFDFYNRKKFVEPVFENLCNYYLEKGKKLVLSSKEQVPDPIEARTYWAGIEKFTVEDYNFLCSQALGSKSKRLDISKIFRFAPKLNAHQLKSACAWMADAKDLDTDTFIEYLRSQRMTSNVELSEVEEVDIRSLKGFDDVIEALEANIIIPLEQDELANEFGIKPKRGVLLAGPPGTGKTTVGRALAHRLRSKFFLIDGTYVSGSDTFYARISQVFEAAKNNAPAIIFIDDSDVIFENKEDFGLYRYLLTMLDGLEGESNKRICVMMTTMDVASVPPALVRSGRIELWLETRHPDHSARLEILQDRTASLPEVLKNIELGQLADETEGMTGADLRRLIDDTKILYAYDKARKKPLHDSIHYFQKAIETIRSNKAKYEDAESKALQNAAFAGGRSMPHWRMAKLMAEDDD
jgi:ATP-dependent 26S proteasome regulatory subunit